MKHVAFIVFIIVLFCLYLFIPNILEFFSDLSSIVFFLFATVSMISISALVAIDSAKLLKYKTLNNEYENLKDELHHHITRNVYTIDFSEESYIKHNELKELENRISTLKGSRYESE